MINNMVKVKTIVLLFCLFVSPNLFCQKPVVDERFELTGIAFQLTGINGLVQQEPEIYVADINQYFKRHKNHELIVFLEKTIREKSEFSLSLIAELASDIEFNRNAIVYSSDYVTNYNSNDYGKSAVDWTKDELEEYLRLLNKFYKETDFHTFYQAHKKYYDRIENNYQTLICQIDSAWFNRFFGYTLNIENVWVSPSFGVHNFELTRYDNSGHPHYGCALGHTSSDSLGNPIFNERQIRILTHEMMHNYTNSICAKYKEDFQPICDSIYTYVGNTLSSNYYGSSSDILFEGINRLCEHSYYKDHDIYDAEKMNSMIARDERDGFVWMSEMLSFLEQFHSRRNQFPTFDCFMPQLVGFLQHVHTNMKIYYLPKLQMAAPCVLYAFPAFGSTMDTIVDHLEIVFSQPMFTNYFFVKNVSDGKASSLPIDFDNIYWKDAHTYVLPFSEPLKAHTKYGFRVIGAISANHIKTIPYDLIFETK